jgi:hypothetical protein
VASEIKGTTRGGSKTAHNPLGAFLAGTKSQLRKGDFSSREGENDKAHYLPQRFMYIYYLFCAPAHLILREKKKADSASLFAACIPRTHSSQREKDLKRYEK